MLSEDFGRESPRSAQPRLETQASSTAHATKFIQRLRAWNMKRTWSIVSLRNGRRELRHRLILQVDNLSITMQIISTHRIQRVADVGILLLKRRPQLGHVNSLPVSHSVG